MIINLTESNKEYIAELEEKFPNVFLINDISNDFKNNPYTRYLVYLIENKIIGFINYYEIYDRIEIVNFNVLDFFQDKHLGSMLLKKLIENAKEKKMKNITLEVRKDNLKAIHIYEKYGFKNICVREKYYNGVDGILMEKELM